MLARRLISRVHPDDLRSSYRTVTKGIRMTQTPRQVVTKTLTFQNPARIPRHLWILPWAEKRYPNELNQLRRDYPDDIVKAPNIYQPSPLVKGDPYEVGTYVDEWGCVFENVQYGIVGEVRDPILKNIKDYKCVNIPYELFPDDEQKAIEEVNRFCSSTEKFVIAPCCPRPWERYQFIRGTINAMMDVIAPVYESEELLLAIHKFYLRELEFWAKTDVDALMFMDDWGSQQSLLINPDLWRQLFKPLYKAYCDIAHSNNKFIFMHSDGNILQIYPDLIDIGVDAINSQLFVIDMVELSKIGKGKITFWGEIDRQHILTTPDLSRVRRSVRTVARHLHHPAGGIIAQFEFGPGVLPENAKAVFAEWERISREIR